MSKYVKTQDIINYIENELYYRRKKGYTLTMDFDEISELIEDCVNSVEAIEVK